MAIPCAQETPSCEQFLATTVSLQTLQPGCKLQMPESKAFSGLNDVCKWLSHANVPSLHPLVTHNSICCSCSNMPTSKNFRLNWDLAESKPVAANGSHEEPFSSKHTTQRWNIYLGRHANSTSWCVCSLLRQWAAKLTCTADSVTEATTDSFLLLTLASVKVNCVSLLLDVPCLANSSSSQTLTPLLLYFLAASIVPCPKVPSFFKFHFGFNLTSSRRNTFQFDMMLKSISHLPLHIVDC